MFDINVYSRKRNKIVMAFLNGVKDNSKDINSIKQGVAIEQIYSLNYPKLIAPISFIANVVQYQTTQSKSCISLNSKMYPCGSYPLINKWLTSQSETETVFPRRDCMVAFDNDQVVGKTWTVKANNKVNMSIVTSVCAVEFDTDHQFNEDIHPKLWFKYDGLSEKLQSVRNRKGPIYDNVYDTHYQHLYSNVHTLLTRTYNEQKEAYNDGSFHDQIDAKIQKEDSKKQEIECALCGKIYRKTKIKCDNCKVNLRESLKRANDDLDLKESEECEVMKKRKSQRLESEVQFEINPSDIKVSTRDSENDKNNSVFVHALDPLPLNPNSYESVKLVMRKIGIDAGIDRYKLKSEDNTESRKWVFIMCDGLPYGLAHKLIHNCYYCVKCHDSVLGLEKFKEHHFEKHNSESYQIILEFDWVVLLIGKGHFEMNMLKSFFELNWEPCLKYLAILTNFKTEKALHYAKGCFDNHKSWQLLKIFYFGTLYELLVPYVRGCILSEKEPTVEAYISWCKDCVDPNYLYMHEQILTYCQALLNYRHGLRSQNFDLIFSGKEMFAPIFFGRSHSKYQYISLMDTCDFLMYPKEIQSMVETHCSFNTSGKDLKSEDLDFKLETINKKSKAWMHGVPNFETWLKIFRNLDKLDELRKNFSQTVGLQVESGPLFVPENEDLDNWSNIIDWRCFLRRNRYLLQPMESAELKSVSGNKLDQELLHFTDLSIRNRNIYFDTVILSGNMGETCKLKLVYITPTEREIEESISKQPKETIVLRIEENIEKILDGDLQEYYQSIFNTVKGQKKEDLIDLYFEVLSDIDDMPSNINEAPSE